MKIKRINLYLRVIFSLVVLVTSSGNVWAEATSCKYTKSGTEIDGSGMGGTGMVAHGTGMGGTGVRSDAGSNGMQIAGTVVGSEGKVEAQRNGYSRLLTINDPVCVGETLVASELGRIQIKMADGGLIEIRPQTKLKIEAFIYARTKNDSSLIALLDGSCRFVTGEIGKNNPQNDLIRTPNAIIGVRGTDHEATVILHGEDGNYTSGTYDKVNSGVTFIRTEKGEIDIHPEQVGFATSVEELPSLLRDIPEFYDADPSAKQEGVSAEGGGKDIGENHKLNQPSDAQTPSSAPHELQHTMESVESPLLPERPDIMESPELPELPELPETPEPIIPELP